MDSSGPPRLPRDARSLGRSSGARSAPSIDSELRRRRRRRLHAGFFGERGRPVGASQTDQAASSPSRDELWQCLRRHRRCPTGGCPAELPVEAARGRSVQRDRRRPAALHPPRPPRTQRQVNGLRGFGPSLRGYDRGHRQRVQGMRHPGGDDELSGSPRKREPVRRALRDPARTGRAALPRHHRRRRRRPKGSRPTPVRGPR
mmetsp:Transcript_58981/g.133567  ORF Transcript_58981/g.133567 Transcript_58981/m.133567 type:complete len:202 (+) Transcript_58981:1050-1655(+)